MNRFTGQIISKCGWVYVYLLKMRYFNFAPMNVNNDFGLK